MTYKISQGEGTEILLSKAWSLYEADKRLLGYSKYTMKAYEIQLRLLVRSLGDVDIEGITFPQLKMYLAAQTHLKPASIGHRIRFLKSLFKWAHDEGFVTANTSSKLREPKSAFRLPKNFTDEDLELLREGCQTPREHALVELFYATGCRVGEVEGLNRNMVNWETRSVVVFGKGSKEREVYFTVKAAIWLKKYLQSRNDTNVALFVTERKYDGGIPRRLSISQIRGSLKKIAQRAGVEVAVYPHKLRHTFAMSLLNNGAPLELIQSYLGHSKLETTRIYATLAGPRRRELYQKYFR